MKRHHLLQTMPIAAAIFCFTDLQLKVAGGFLANNMHLPDGKRTLCLFCDSELPRTIAEHHDWFLVTTTPVDEHGRELKGQMAVSVTCPKCSRRDDYKDAIVQQLRDHVFGGDLEIR